MNIAAMPKLKTPDLIKMNKVFANAEAALHDLTDGHIAHERWLWFVRNSREQHQGNRQARDQERTRDFQQHRQLRARACRAFCNTDKSRKQHVPTLAEIRTWKNRCLPVM